MPLKWRRVPHPITTAVWIGDIHPSDNSENLGHYAHIATFKQMSIGHPIPELQLFQNLTLEIKGQGHGWGHSSKSQCGSNILSTHIPFVPCQSALPFLRYSIFKIWPSLKIQGQGQTTMMLHNYRSRQFRRTSNGTNPSSSFNDMGSAKSGPSPAWFDTFWAHGQAHMEQMGKLLWHCTTTGLDKSTKL